MVFHRAHLLEGEHCVFNVGRHPSLQQQQVDTLRDPVGSRRLIAVNCKYICYCLPSLNSVSILGRNVASRGVFRGHRQRVTDIEFFAEDVPLLASVSSDGRLFVWRIVENASADREFELHPQVIFAIQLEGPWNNILPCVSWHPESQECLLMCLRDLVLRIDIGEAWKKASHFKFSADSFLICSIANLIDGVSCIGHHDADVTDLSVFLGDCLYVASASRDGTVRIWGSGQTSPLAVLMPHEGQPVGCVFFITSHTQPDEAVLLTSDIASKNLKLWVPVATSRTCCGWYSVQTLEFKNCNGNLPEQMLPNHYCIVPQAGLVLFGGLENSAIYSVHLKFGNASSAVRMHFLAEFFVSVPILSITAVTETGSSGKHIAHVFCVQTEAIQEYFLNISYRLSSQCSEPGLLSSSAALFERSFMKMPVYDAFAAKEDGKCPDLEAKEVAQIASGNTGSACEHNLVANPGSGFGSWVEVPSWIAATVKTSSKGISMEAKATNLREKNLAYRVSPLASGTCVGSTLSYEEEPSHISRTSGDISIQSSFLPKSSMLSTDLSNLKIAQDGIFPVVHLTCGLCHIDTTTREQVPTLSIQSDSLSKQLCGISSMVGSRQKEIVQQEEVDVRLEGASAVLATKVTAVLGGIESAVNINRVDFLDVMAVGSDKVEVPTEIGLEHFDPGMDSMLCKEKEQDALIAMEELQVSAKCQEHENDGGEATLTVKGLSNTSKKKRNRRKIKGSNRAHKSTTAMPAVNVAEESVPLLCRNYEYAIPNLSKLVVQDKVDGSFSPSINSPEDLSLQFSAMQESLDQLLVFQRQIQEDVCSLAEVPLSSEFDPPSALVQDYMSNGAKTHLDPLWRQFGEKLEDKDAVQQECTNQLLKASNELLAMVKTTATPMLLAEVLQLIGSNIGPLISSCIENALTTSLLQNAEDCNRKLMKSVESGFEASLNSTVKEQLDSIWHFFGKHLMQEELRSNFCEQAVLKVEQSCRNGVEHWHFSICEGIVQPFGLLEQQSSLTGLAVTSSLKDTLLSALSIASSLKQELQDVERSAWNLIKNPNARYSFSTEVTGLLVQGHLEDAFTLVLSRGDSSLTSWICKQADLKTLLQSGTLPLSQGVILSLIEQLAADLGHEGIDKLSWIESACLAIYPGSHPELCMRMRATLERVFLLLQQQTNLFTGDVKLANQVRLVMHLVNSLRTLCA